MLIGAEWLERPVDVEQGRASPGGLVGKEGEVSCPRRGNSGKDDAEFEWIRGEPQLVWRRLVATG